MADETRPPQDFPRRILLATVGLVPQVVTETLFALVRQQETPFVPTEIRVVTTADGSERTRLMLLDRTYATMARFAQEFEVPELAVALTLERIHVIADNAGNALADITSEAGSRATADLITRLVRELTADPASALHVSIAGGRKTMGFLLGTALSIYGRAQDRLSHVLVEPANFEQHPKFFYPPRLPVVLQDTREPNRPLDTRDARVVLAEIPFVRLRNGLPQRLLDGDWSYSETVERAQDLVRMPRLIVDKSSGRISCGGVIVSLTPVLMAFYAWLAERRLRLGSAAGIHANETPPVELVSAHLGIDGLSPDAIDRLRRETADGFIPRELIEQRKARINAVLTAQLGQSETAYHIAVLDHIPGTRLARQGLSLAPEAISFGAIASQDATDD